MTEIMDGVRAIRHAADMLECAQRCHNHLTALLACWDQVDDEDRFAMLVVAADRLGVTITPEHRARAADEYAILGE